MGECSPPTGGRVLVSQVLWEEVVAGVVPPAVDDITSVARGERQVSWGRSSSPEPVAWPGNYRVKVCLHGRCRVIRFLQTFLVFVFLYFWYYLYFSRSVYKLNFEWSTLEDFFFSLPHNFGLSSVYSDLKVV